MSNPDVPELRSLLQRNDVQAHLVGCGGAGMRALAEYAADLGWSVSGCDTGLSERTRSKLEAVGVRVSGEHSAEHVSEGCDLVVYTPAVAQTHPELVAATANGVSVASYPQFLGEVSRSRPTIAVAGTHGKSTTTGLIATALSAAREAAAVFCGAEVLEKRRHGWAGSGKWAVVEACEYRRHFLQLQPGIAIVLGIEPDHFDCFPHLDQAIDAYCSFLHAAKPDGLALVNVDSEAARTMLGEARVPCRLETMSTRSESADWITRDVRCIDRLEITVCYRGQVERRLSVPLVGEHHAANVLAAYAACRAAGADVDQLPRALVHFGGLARRLEPHPDWRGVRRFDDYAHHPTAVSAALRALRSGMKASSSRSAPRLVCLFQPHQISRTERLATQFGDALSAADEAWVLPVYAAREGAGSIAEDLSQSIVRSISAPCLARFIPSLDHALSTLETALRPGDILVTLGAGDIDCLQYELPRRFP